MFLKITNILSFFLAPMLGIMSGNCQEIIPDSSLQRNSKFKIISLGEDTRVLIVPICKGSLQGISFVHVHEDESTSLEAATEFLDSLGMGCLMTLKHGMGRNISFRQGEKNFRFDPNRIYTDSGRVATLKRFGEFSDSAFQAISVMAAYVTSQFIDSNQLVVALHNNTNEGGLTIKSYQKGGAYAVDAAKVWVNKREDEDDFFYTTSERAYDFFRKRGFNVMLQNNETVTDDGSLSVYAGMKGIDYINIEAEHGRKDQQKRMLLAIMEYINQYYRPS